ncbi:MAG: response regulator transcription factor [Elusimicrobia bacterium]|nr:response regulator transcription factor [Elusimicrobiota bacterium]
MARVMIIEDDNGLLSMLGDLLSKDHEVSAFFDPRLAKLALAQGKQLPQVILLDVMLPGLDGYSFMSELLADERTSGIPVIIMTAKANMADVFRGMPNLAGFLDKPFSAAAMAQLVAKAASQAG